MSSNKIKQLGGKVETAVTDKMLVKHYCKIAIPVGNTDIIAEANAPSEEKAFKWAMYALESSLGEAKDAYGVLFEGHQRGWFQVVIGLLMRYTLGS